MPPRYRKKFDGQNSTNFLSLKFIFVEEPCSIVDALKDIEIIEKNSTALQLCLTKPRKVVWMKDRCPISVDEDDRMSIVDEGIKHCLRISDAALEDSGNYSVEVDDLDYGKLESSCCIHVKGVVFSLGSSVHYPF